MDVCGSPEPISLITKKQKGDVKKCIICQNIKDKNKNTKLTTTEEGRKIIIAASNSLKEGLLYGLNDEDLTNIYYHVNTCYPNYRKKSERLELKGNDTAKSTPVVADAKSPHHSCIRTKRVKIVDSQIPQMKNGIVCNQAKCRGDSLKLCICEKSEQKSFYLQSSLIKMKYLQDAFSVKQLETFLLLM